MAGLSSLGDWLREIFSPRKRKEVAGVAQEEPELDSVVKETLMLLESHHRETYHHSRRVANYSVLIGKRLGIEGEELASLYYGALLHDVGKLRVPKEILENRRTLWQRLRGESACLSEEEIGIIKSHPLMGYTFLRNNGFKEEVAEIALYHHMLKGGYPGEADLRVIEKEGYPTADQLVEMAFDEDYVPPLPEIVSVADTFDAITSDREYQKQRSVKDALDILEETMGSQHEMKCVEILLEVIRANEDLVEALHLYSLTEPLEYFS